MEFVGVRITKKANIYFDGKVTSRTIIFEDGERKTLGFMLAGNYEFNTEAEELMEVLGGEMIIKVKGEEKEVLYKEGESFIIPKNWSFAIRVDNYADYCCSYKK